MLRECPNSGYRYLPGISAFSSGVIATPGWEIVHATLGTPLPWREGFARIERHLREHGRSRAALCGIELRSPAPFTFEGFAAFNESYRALLADWQILVGDDNPITRDVYTRHTMDTTLVDEILGPAGTAAIHGLRWFPSHPPIQGLEFEVDMRGVAREVLL